MRLCWRTTSRCLSSNDTRSRAWRQSSAFGEGVVTAVCGRGRKPRILCWEARVSFLLGLTQRSLRRHVWVLGCYLVPWHRPHTRLALHG